MSSKLHTAGIRSTKGLSGGVRGKLWPLGQAAVGLASALAAGGALAQEATPVTQQGAENTFTLPTVKVEESAETREYNAEKSGLTRLPQPLINTPQTVTVVTEKVIEEQNATTVREALRNVSGITVSAGEGGRQGDTFNLRGFSAQNDTFRDGVRDLGWFTRDTFNLGGVEVFFGPSSVLFGRGSTGGAINLTTKRAGKRVASSVSLSGNTSPGGRLEADVNHVINDRVQARVNLLGQLSHVAGRDFVSENRFGFAPSLTVALGANTSLDFDYLYQREDSLPDYGGPYYRGYPVGVSYGVKRGAFYGVKDEDRERVNAHVATARFQHRFGEGLESSPRLTNTLRLGGVDRFARPTAPRGLTPATDPLTIGRQRFETNNDNLYLVNQTDLRGELQTGFIKQTANVGLELTREWRSQSRHNLTGTPAADLFDPNPSPDLSGVTRALSGTNESSQWDVGVYAADQVSLSRYVDLLGSARLDIFRTRYSATAYSATAPEGTLTALENKDTIFNWRVGILLHPLEKTSVYAMYGTSANPSAEAGTLANNNATLAPERNNTVEIGAKAELVESRLGLNASVFRIDKTNARVASTDPTQQLLVLEGAQRVQGYNLGVTGQVTSAWRVLANYTHMQSAIVSNPNDYLEGQPLPSTPKRSLSLWTTVSVFDGLTLGGGAVYQDEATVNNPASEAVAYNRVPGYWRLDAFASYSLLRRVDLQLNVNNLTDRLYYDQYYAGQAVPAAARSAWLTARVRF